MSDPATPAAGNSAADLFHQLFAAIGGHIASDGKSLLVSFFTAVQADPSTQNVIAQGAILAASAPTQLPKLEQQSITDVANIGLQLTALIDPAPATS